MSRDERRHSSPFLPDDFDIGKPVSKALKGVNVSPSLHNGILLHQLKDVTCEKRKRYLYISEDNTHIYIYNTPQSKKFLSKIIFSYVIVKKRRRCRKMHLGSIERVDIGRSSTHNFALRNGLIEEDEVCFSIIYNDDNFMHLTIPPTSSVQGTSIINTVQNLLDVYKESKLVVGKEALLLKHIWFDIDKRRQFYVRRKEFERILKRINFLVDRETVQKHALMVLNQTENTVQKKNPGSAFSLTPSQCVACIYAMKQSLFPDNPVNAIWNDCFTSRFFKKGEARTKVNAHEFSKGFLHDLQTQSIGTSESIHRGVTYILSTEKSEQENNNKIRFIREIFLKLNSLDLGDPTVFQQSDSEAEVFIDKRRFEEYLMSADNDIFDPEMERYEPATMNQPLSHYWINSSHNTYLDGNQLTSQSCTDMYTEALNRGCRCVEIDIWDGEVDSCDRPIPVVTHGNTLTSKINFSDVIETINAFLELNPSCTPILLSLENHCTAPFRDAMAEVLETTFQSRLLIPNEQYTSMGSLPSPASLTGKVFLKGKIKKLDSIANNEIIESDEEKFGESDGTSFEKTDLLSRLIFIQGRKFKSLEESNNNKYYVVHSLKEEKAKKKFKSTKDWIVYHQTCFTRTYPGGLRIDSSNFNPLWSWAAGAQLVSLNFQTDDEKLWLNDGRFRENGGCGYVLKPRYMLQEKVDHMDQTLAPLRLQVKVLSGSCLPKPNGEKSGEIIDSYVKVWLWDVDPADNEDSVVKERTHTVDNNGFSPNWAMHGAHSNSTFNFVVKNKYVAMLQFMVYDADLSPPDDFIASSAIPVMCVRSGYRSVRLFDKHHNRNGVFDFATLLVNISIS